MGVVCVLVKSGEKRRKSGENEKKRGESGENEKKSGEKRREAYKIEKIVV